MSKFKVGDRVVMTKDRDSAQKGMKGTIVATMECGDWGVRFDEKFDGGHDLRGKCETGYGHWIAPDEMEIFEEPKFEVGQIYRVGETSESGNIIKITKNEPSRLRPFCYETIRGAEKTSSRFGENSRFANSLELLTGPQIGEAIRKYDADHAEKKTGVREVKSRAKAGEYIKIVHAVPAYRQQYANGDIFRVMKDHAFFAADVEVDGVPGFIDAKEYVVLEGYQPEKEEHRKAKVGNTIEVLRDNGGPVKSGTVWTVNKIDDRGLTIHNADYPEAIWRLDLDNYIVLSSDKHTYTDAEIAEAKKLCGEMMVEAFDDNERFAFYLYDKFNGGWSGDCAENEVKAEFKSFGGTDASGIAKCSDHDKYNVWIGRCVALCKALHKPVPAFIMGSGDGRHFDFEKAKAKGANPYFTGEKVVTIHCKTESEARRLLGELSHLGYRWPDGAPLLSEINFSNGDGYYNAYSSKTVTFNRSTFENVAEFSDCFTED